MKLRGIEFGWVIGASGVQGFFGEGYPYHNPYKMLFPRGFSFAGMTFCGKTFTHLYNEGNMPLREDGVTPREFKPKCIYVNRRSFFQGAAVNAVGLSNFGLGFYLQQGRWQRRKTPFFLSFMPIGKSYGEQIQEAYEVKNMLFAAHNTFSAPYGLQLNLSCPNLKKTGRADARTESDMLEHSRALLTLLSELGVPLVPKVSVMMSHDIVAEISNHPACDAICVTNTLPWSCAKEEDLRQWFGITESPLEKYGGGGISGAPLFPLLTDWLERSWGLIDKPIIAGGGILHPRHVRIIGYTNASAVSIGTAAMLRPWRLRSILNEGNRIFAQKHVHESALV